jgi:hypothetical protein
MFPTLAGVKIMDTATSASPIQNSATAKPEIPAVPCLFAPWRLVLSDTRILQIGVYPGSWLTAFKTEAESVRLAVVKASLRCQETMPDNASHSLEEGQCTASPTAIKSPTTANTPIMTKSGFIAAAGVCRRKESDFAWRKPSGIAVGMFGSSHQQQRTEKPRFYRRIIHAREAWARAWLERAAFACSNLTNSTAVEEAGTFR